MSGIRSSARFGGWGHTHRAPHWGVIIVPLPLAHKGSRALAPVLEPLELGPRPVPRQRRELARPVVPALRWSIAIINEVPGRGGGGPARARIGRDLTEHPHSDVRRLARATSRWPSETRAEQFGQLVHWVRLISIHGGASV